MIYIAIDCRLEKKKSLESEELIYDKFKENRRLPKDA